MICAKFTTCQQSMLNNSVQSTRWVLVSLSNSEILRAKLSYAFGYLHSLNQQDRKANLYVKILTLLSEQVTFVELPLVRESGQIEPRGTPMKKSMLVIIAFAVMYVAKASGGDFSPLFAYSHQSAVAAMGVQQDLVTDRGSAEPLAPPSLFMPPQSWCLGSLCVQSNCIGSGCAGSICIGSGCFGSVCVVSGCVPETLCLRTCEPAPPFIVDPGLGGPTYGYSPGSCGRLP